MVGRHWRKIVVVALAMAAALVVSAPAASGAGEPDTGGYGAFVLEGSNGYRVIVLANSGRGYRNGEVLILISRKGSFVSYYAPATVTDTRIQADLGALGRIDLEFAPSGSKGTVRSQCDPQDKLTYDKGAYVGAVELHGEEGYTEVSATRVSPWPRFFLDFGCSTVGYGEFFGPGLPGARLIARTQTSGGNLALQVNQNRPGARVSLIASTEERRGSIQIDRQVEVTGSAESFSFAPDLGSAVVRPQGPFSGGAVFRRDAKRGARWSGSLKVDFPGRSNVPLTGGRFQVSLRHAHFTK